MSSDTWDPETLDDFVPAHMQGAAPIRFARIAIVSVSDSIHIGARTPWPTPACSVAFSPDALLDQFAAVEQEASRFIPSTVI